MKLLITAIFILSSLIAASQKLSDFPDNNPMKEINQRYLGASLVVGASIVMMGMQDQHGLEINGFALIGVAAIAYMSDVVFTQNKYSKKGLLDHPELWGKHKASERDAGALLEYPESRERLNLMGNSVFYSSSVGITIPISCFTNNQN